MKTFIPKRDLIEKDELILQLFLLLEGTDGAAKMCPLHISTQAEYIHRCSNPQGQPPRSTEKLSGREPKIKEMIQHFHSSSLRFTPSFKSTALLS